MPDSKFDLGDYVEVRERIRVFYDRFGDGRLVTANYTLTNDPDDKPKVIVEAHAYRTPDDPHPGVGLSWMYLPGTTNYTRGSELENVETSSWGRAIAALGILVDRSVASANEVRNKANAEPSERNPRVGAADHQPPPERTDGGLIGTAEKGTARTSDYAVRQSPEGPFLGFRLKDGRSKGGQLIEAWGPLAEALGLMESAVIGQRVQVWGHLQKRDLSNGGSYQAFVIERITGPDFTLPATSVEPDSLPLFDPDTEAELDAAATA